MVTYMFVLCVYIHIYTHTYMCVCVYIIYIYIHTYTHLKFGDQEGKKEEIGTKKLFEEIMAETSQI